MYSYTQRVYVSSACCLFATLVAATPTRGQTASALFREGGSLPGSPSTVSSINNPATNHVGGYAAQVNTADGISHVWGNASGGAGTVIRSEGTFGIYTQTSFESFYGISDSGKVAYSPTVTGGVLASADSVWLDSTPVAVAGNAHPTLPGQFWSFGSRPGVTAGGTPYFVGGITSTQGGSTQNRGLFYGMDGGTVMLLGGTTPPNLPRALSMTATNPAFDYRVSANGSNWIGNVTMISPTSDDTAMMLNGSGLMAGGSLAQEAHAIPAAVGGQVGENWQNFDFSGVNNAGDYFFTGDSSLAATADEFIFKNGQMLYRDGTLLDGQTLQGDIEAAYMNEGGDLAIIWDIAGGTLEALYLNNKLVLKEGDLVDLSGDGIVEPNSAFRDFTGISSLAIGEQIGGLVDIYFAGDVDVNNTPGISTDDIEGFFRITVPEPGTLWLLSIGCLGIVRRRTR